MIYQVETNLIHHSSQGYWGSNHEEFLLNFPWNFLNNDQYCLWLVTAALSFKDPPIVEQDLADQQMNGEDLWQLTNHRLEQSDNSFSIDVSPADIFVTVIDILVNGDLLFIIQTELYYTPYHYLSRIEWKKQNGIESWNFINT